MNILNLIFSSFNIIYEIVGPTLYIFIAFIAFEIVFFIAYSNLRKKIPEYYDKYEKEERQLRELFFAITYGAAPVGFIGTFLGILKAFNSMGGVDLNIMLGNLFHGTQQAMVSSIVGLGIFLINRFIMVFTNWPIFNDKIDERNPNEEKIDYKLSKTILRLFSEVYKKEEKKDQLSDKVSYYEEEFNSSK